MSFYERLSKCLDESVTRWEIKLRDTIDEALKKRSTNSLAKSFIKDLGFWNNIYDHPLLRKVIDWGNISRVCGKNIEQLEQVLNQIVKAKTINPNDINVIETHIKQMIQCVKDQVIRAIGDEKEGIRHIHSPGSVAIGEARNLYFGEVLDQESLYGLASRLCESVTIGSNIGIYSVNSNVMDSLRQFSQKRFGSRSQIDPREVCITRDSRRRVCIEDYERDKPYTVFIKFLFWLKEQAESGVLEKDLLDQLKVSPFVLFFVPQEKARWSVLGLPRLDIFISRYIEDDRMRGNLISFFGTIGEFIRRARGAAREERAAVDNAIKILAHYEEILSESLLKYGIIDYRSLRALQDVMIGLSLKYNVGIPLWKTLLIE